MSGSGTVNVVSTDYPLRERPAADEIRTLRLRAPQHRVHRKAILWWTLRPLVCWLALVVGQLVIARLVPGAPGWLPITIVAAAVLGLLHVVVMPQWRYRVHRWETTEQAVYTQTGWLNQEWRVAPVSRIQTVDTERGPLAQALGLATVIVTTASAAGPVRIAGLDYPTAVRLVDELTANTQANQGDAT